MLREAFASRLRLVKSYGNRLTPRRVGRKLSSVADRALARAAQRLPLRRGRRCMACGSDVVRFYRFGAFTRCCPVCDSTDRERHLHLAMERGLLRVPEGSREDGPVILHLAPGERQLSRRLARMGRLIKGDYEPARYGAGTIRVDLMDLSACPPFDVVVLSHVLEHVPDDRHAMREVHAKLPAGGQAWIQVPLIYDRTEDGAPSMTASEREARFGGSDHLRAYGPDITDRLADAGFAVSVISANDREPEERAALGVKDDVIFLAVRT